MCDVATARQLADDCETTVRTVKQNLDTLVSRVSKVEDKLCDDMAAGVVSACAGVLLSSFALNEAVLQLRGTADALEKQGEE